MFVTEYGVADVRGKSDHDVIAAMLAIADSRFQGELIREAKDAGKLAKDYEIPAAHRENFPERIARGAQACARCRRAAVIPIWLRLHRGRAGADSCAAAPARGLRVAGRDDRLLFNGLVAAPVDEAVLARLGLDKPRSLSDRLYRVLVSAAIGAS